MKYRQLGKSGIKVSEIGFGAWGLGGDKGGARAYGPVDDRQSEAALRRALELGINFYDTADFYGFGHSEEILGKAFKGQRPRVVYAGKVGFVDPNGRQDFTRKHILRSIEGTLRRLGTDYLDVYQLQSPPVNLLVDTMGGNLKSSRQQSAAATCSRLTPLRRLKDTERASGISLSEPIETMRELQKEGLIRSWGVSLKSPDDGLVLLKSCALDCIQVNFNLTDQRARQNGLFDLCRERAVGVIVRTPLCFGFLTGQYADQNQLAESDHRRQWPEEQVKVWHEAAKLFAPFLEKSKQTQAQLALRFGLSYRAVSTVIPGMLTTSQVEENALASRLGALPPKELAEIQQIYKTHDFFIRR